MYCLVPGNGFARGGRRQASFVIDIARCRPKPAKHGVKKDRGFLACQLLCGCGGADDVSQWKSATKRNKCDQIDKIFRPTVGQIWKRCTSRFDQNTKSNDCTKDSVPRSVQNIKLGESTTGTNLLVLRFHIDE